MKEEEFELTYLANNLPKEVYSSRSKEIIDIYLPVDESHPILRIRKSGDTYEITKKHPISEGDASHQIEHTIKLTAHEYKDLEKLEGKRIVKVRYYYNYNGKEFEVDVFKEKLEGLILVDAEFKSRQEKDSFAAPDWILADVTQENFIAGGQLAGKSFSDIEDKLKKFNY